MIVSFVIRFVTLSFGPNQTYQGEWLSESCACALRPPCIPPDGHCPSAASDSPRCNSSRCGSVGSTCAYHQQEYLPKRNDCMLMENSHWILIPSFSDPDCQTTRRSQRTSSVILALGSCDPELLELVGAIVPPTNTRP